MHLGSGGMHVGERCIDIGGKGRVVQYVGEVENIALSLVYEGGVGAAVAIFDWWVGAGELSCVGM